MKSVWGWRPAAVGALVCVMVGVAAGGAAAGERAPAPGSPLVLAGQSDLAAGDYKKAIEVLEQAVAQDSRNARAYLLLGRAYGHRAETAFAVAAPALAIKARQNFEKAVALDPQSRDALDDLFEFYMQAPGILGEVWTKRRISPTCLSTWTRRKPASTTDGSPSAGRSSARRKRIFDGPCNSIRNSPCTRRSLRASSLSEAPSR